MQRHTTPARRRRLTTTLTLGAALTLAATACGNEPADSIAPTSTSAPTTPAPSAPSVTTAPTTTPSTTIPSTTIPSTSTPATATPTTAGAGAVDGWDDVLAGIAEAHAGDGIVGAVLALRHPDGETVRVTAGTQTVDGGLPVDPSVAWGIGSITKTFVAVVVLQLAEEGAIDLDVGIDRWFPDLADVERITPRQLLQHTSGLGEYMNTPEVQTGGTRRWAPAELIAIAEAVGRSGEPGGAHQYANTNYIVLGELVERVTGHPWFDEVRTRIVAPLNLTSTSIIGATSAPGFAVIDGAFVDQSAAWDPSVGGAAGAMQSTTDDLLAFATALADGSLLDDETEAAFTTMVPAEDLTEYGVVHSYGLGLEQYVSGDITVLGHLGVGNTHSAFVGFDVDSGTAVAVMLNTTVPGPQAVMALEALAVVAGDVAS